MTNFWLNLPKPISALAPMHGVTSFLFRELQCLIAKPSVTYTEFISADGLTRVPKKFDNQLRISNAQKPIVAQLFGSNPAAFCTAIKIVKELGFDGIDINMGCPALKVVKHGGGGALIGNYPIADKLLTAVITESHTQDIPISLKTRVVQNVKANRDWFNFIADYPVTTVVIHGRFLKQEHSGEVSWDSVKVGAEILKEKGIIVLSNGGTQNKNQGIEICKNYNLDGFMIGQAAIGNPYTFANEEYSAITRLETLKLITKLLEKDKCNLTMTRVHQFVFLSLKGWPNISTLKQLIAHQSDIMSVINTLDQYISQQSQQGVALQNS